MPGFFKNVAGKPENLTLTAPSVRPATPAFVRVAAALPLFLVLVPVAFDDKTLFASSLLKEG